MPTRYYKTHTQSGCKLDTHSQQAAQALAAAPVAELLRAAPGFSVEGVINAGPLGSCVIEDMPMDKSSDVVNALLFGSAAGPVISIKPSFLRTA
jgi:hypothetical protein